MFDEKKLNNTIRHLGKSLIDQGATYCSLILIDKKNVIFSQSTNDAWDIFYQESKLSSHCHLIRAVDRLVTYNQEITLFWDMCKPDNEISAYISNKRMDYNLCHGVSFCSRNLNNITEILTITGHKNNINFSKNVLKNKGKIIQEVVRQQCPRPF